MKKSRKYYNNGLANMMIADGDPIPDGFVPGMVKRSPEDRERSNQKRKKTNLDKYGVEAPLQSAKIREQTRQTNLTRYGVENPSQSKEIQEKREQTFLRKFGATSSFSSDVVREKIAKTNLSRYGAENPFASEEIQEKIRQTNLERLGVEYPTQSEDVREKVKQTCEDRYGVSNPNQSKEIQDKSKRTSLERYGTEYPMQSKEIQDKSKATLFSHYGVTRLMDSEVLRGRIRDTNRERYGVSCTLQSEEVKQKISQTCQEMYGVPWACMRPEARAHSNDSGPNREFAALLDSLGISYEREFHINSFSYDFKVGNTLIEIDPFATHNSLWNPFGGSGVEKTYHLHKSEVASQSGYRVIHVFDWDDVKKIPSLLRDRQTVYARKCEVREVNQDDCGKFLSEYHLQGSCKGQKIRYGLYCQEQLISLMTFGEPRYNSKYQYELIRYCSSMNVIGGAKKLFTHFVRDFKPVSIVSYCDRAKFSGIVYTELGMTMKSVGSPSCHWYSRKTKRHITDNLLRQRGADQLLGTSFGKGTSNEDIMIGEGYVPVYDCGQATYVWKSPEVL